MSYKATYKCRLCGETFTDGTTGKDLAEITTIALTVADHTQHVRNVNMHRSMIHYCKDGSCGFGDFLGFKNCGDE